MSGGTITRQFLGKEIIAEITVLDSGINILLFGGELTHIGAVSTMSQNGVMNTIQFPEHKEAVLCEKWVKEIYELMKVPVAVEAGIHYHDATKEQINQILFITDDILSEVLLELKFNL